MVKVEAQALPYVEAQGPRLTPNAHLFGRLTERAAWDAHTDAVKALELEHATLHDARHCYAVNSLREAMNPLVVAHQLGHRDTCLVYTTYGPMGGSSSARPITRASGDRRGRRNEAKSGARCNSSRNSHSRGTRGDTA